MFLIHSVCPKGSLIRERKRRKTTFGGETRLILCGGLTKDKIVKVCLQKKNLLIFLLRHCFFGFASNSKMCNYFAYLLQLLNTRKICRNFSKKLRRQKWVTDKKACLMPIKLFPILLLFFGENKVEL